MVDRLTQRFTSMPCSDNCHIPDRLGTICLQRFSTFPKVWPCRNRIACRTLSRHPVPGFRLPCVFYIVSQLFDFVKNFFDCSEFACCRDCNPSCAFRLSVGILCPVRFAPSRLRVDYITNPFPCQALFSTLSKVVIDGHTVDTFLRLCLPLQTFPRVGGGFCPFSASLCLSSPLAVAVGGHGLARPGLPGGFLSCSAV